jgi:glycosyltransferase involved in cell wall biosynthesis
MPRVSVVVPAFNASQYLAGTLASVTASTFTDYEIVVIDDGSSDDTAAIAERFAPKTRLIRQSNRGMSPSRNTGIESSDSEFIALLDSDDLWHPEKLALQLATLEAKPDCGLCYSEFTLWGGEPDGAFFKTIATPDLDPRLSGWIYPRMILTNFVLPSTAVFRRRLWDNMGPFPCDDQQTDDWEYFVSASRHFPFAKLKSSLVLYRQHPASLSRSLAKTNKTELMREALLARFGMECPQGGKVDPLELAARRYVGQRNFADAHLARGDFLLGLTRFSLLLRSGPRREATLACMARASAHRIRNTLRGKLNALAARRPPDQAPPRPGANA